MIIPVRCFSCGKPVAHLAAEYNKRVNEGENQKIVLDELGVDRFCCRKVFLGQAENIELISRFKKA